MENVAEMIGRSLRRACVLAAGFFAGHRRLLHLAIVVASAVSAHLILRSAGAFLFFDNGWAVCWPMSGILVAVLLLTSRRYWAWILLGYALNQVFAESSEPPLEIVLDVVCIVLESLMAAYALPAFHSLSDWMRQPNLVARFIKIPVLVAPAVTAIPIGLYHHLAFHKSFWQYATRWGFSDTLGIVLWLPLVLVVFSRETYDLFRWPALRQTLVLLGLILLSSWAVFYYVPFSVTFAIMPVLLLIALRLGFSGAVLAVNLLNVIATAGTLHGHGPFFLIPQSYEEYRIFVLQVFVTLAMLMAFPITVVLLERDAFEARLKTAYEQASRLATLDGLTGVANRRSFNTALEDEWRRARRERQPLGLLMIDADCFKLYNDSYGHLAGDECLRRIAGVLQAATQRSGDLAARYGGEEFAVLLPNTDIQGALEVASLVRGNVQAMGLEHTRNTYQVVTISVGCCVMVPKEEHPPESLVKAADEALYAAKQNGRNRVQTLEAGGETRHAS